MCPVPNEDKRDVENGSVEPATVTTTQKDKEHEANFKGKSVSFEEAVGLTKFGKFNYFIIFISGLILNAVLMETLGISFVLPVSECDLRLTTQNKGVLSAIGFLGIITSSHLWGFLADTKGRKRVIKPTLLAACICSLLSSLTNNFYLFAVLRFLNGFFVSGSSATVYAYLGEFHNNQQRGRAIMGAALIFGICCIMLPVIAWLVINQEWAFYIPLIDVVYKPWKLFLIVSSLPSLVSYLAMIILPESPKFVLSQGKQQEAIEILEKMNRWNNGCKSAKPLGIGEIHEEIETIENRKKQHEIKNTNFYLIKSMWSQTAPLFMPPYLKTTLLACTIQFGIYATSNGMYMWFPDILNRMASSMNENPGEKISMCDVITSSLQNQTLTENQRVISNSSEMHCVTKLEISTYEHSIVLELLYAAGFALIGVIINAVGKLIILFVILAGCGAAAFITIFVDIPILAIYSFVILLMCGLAVTVVNASTVELYPTNLRAMAVCISLMMGRVGSVVGANVVGFLLDYHCQGAFLSSGISLIVCSILVFFIPNIHKRSKKALAPRLSISSRVQ